RVPPPQPPHAALELEIPGVARLAIARNRVHVRRVRAVGQRHTGLRGAALEREQARSRAPRAPALTQDGVERLDPFPRLRPVDIVLRGPRPAWLPLRHASSR